MKIAFHWPSPIKSQRRKDPAEVIHKRVGKVENESVGENKKYPAGGDYENTSMECFRLKTKQNSLSVRVTKPSCW